MLSSLKTFGSSALVSLLLIVPFMIMEIVNRREYHEGFPFMLFFVMWFNLFAFWIILLPIVLSRRTGKLEAAQPAPAQRNTLLTNPRSAALISVLLIMSPVLLGLLDRLGLVPVSALLNGPNPGVTYIPGMIINFAIFSLPVAAGVVARGPIVRTLRAGGSLLAYPIHLLIVLFLASTFAVGLASLILDQWPCFIGVPGCD